MEAGIESRKTHTILNLPFASCLSSRGELLASTLSDMFVACYDASLL